MNLIEAIKSGKAFRRTKYNGDWFCAIKPELLALWDPDKGIKAPEGVYFNTDDIIANDWEVRDEAITITRSQLIDALKIAAADFFDDIEDVRHLNVKSFLKQLGF